jgi:uncharacterized membrane protein
MSDFKKHFDNVPNPLKIVLYAVLGVIGFAAMGFVFGLLIQYLWNALMPDIFGLVQISFWQAVGLFVLARFFFGMFHNGHKGEPGRHYHKRRHTRCEDDDAMKDDWKSWKHYDEWWSSEGKQAFRSYVERTKSGAADDSAGD